MAGARALDAGKIYVPREDDDHRLRQYVQWSGDCPCAEACTAASWKKAKSKMWTYEDENVIVEAVMHHLTHSANHMLTVADAQTAVMAHLEEHPESMTHGTEDYEQRDEYRRWADACRDAKKQAIRDGGTASSAARAGTDEYLRTAGVDDRPRMTSMMAEAVAQVESLNEDDIDDVHDALSAVALLTDNGVDLGTGIRQLVPRRGSKRPASSMSTVAGVITPPMPPGPPPNKRSKRVMVEFDLDEIKTLAHVLMNAKSTTKTLHVLTEQMSNNFQSAHVLICQCQSDLRKVMASAAERHDGKSASASSSGSVVVRR